MTVFIPLLGIREALMCESHFRETFFVEEIHRHKRLSKILPRFPTPGMDQPRRAGDLAIHSAYFHHIRSLSLTRAVFSALRAVHAEAVFATYSQIHDGRQHSA